MTTVEIFGKPNVRYRISKIQMVFWKARWETREGHKMGYLQLGQAPRSQNIIP